MPAFVSHGIISYLIFGKRGVYYSAIPDILGFSYYFFRMFLRIDYSNLTFQDILNWGDIFPQSEMNETDWLLYNISHSLVLWFLVYYFTKDKAVYAAILGIIMDIFLHENGLWVGPAFMFPFNDYRFDGIHWLSPKGIIITFLVKLVLILLSSKMIQKFVKLLP
tara:strand:- start:541 stop:1032 length:492 start_codon:yes stop_codon:yes gene_type:complete